MLRIFKKSGQKDKPRSSTSSPAKSTSTGQSSNDVYFGGATAQLQLSSLCSLEEEEENGVRGDQKTEITSFRSSLSKTLPEILADKDALGYFIQFMDARGSIALIKFWLEVECVCGAQESPTEKQQQLDETGDHVRESRNSLTLSDNKNSSRCNIVPSGIGFHDSDQLSQTGSVNSNHIKSNCDDTPKTSQVVREEESNVELSGRRHEAATTRQDALRIYKRYIVKEALGSGRITGDLRAEMEDALSCEDVQHILKCLSSVQQIVYKVMEDEHVNDFLRSDFHCKHQVDVLTSGNVQLSDILYNETAFFYFMEFVELENKRELLDFWMSVVNYKQNLLGKGVLADSMEAQTDALIIYDKYFSLQATMPLGFSDKIRFEVEQNICREDGEGPEPDCFDRPCRIVYNFLNEHYLAPFLSSQLFYQYLSELVSTIQSSACPGLHPRLRRTGSDCSSEVSTLSFSTQSTLQVGNGESSRASSIPATNGSLNIDTRQLYDPDSLWRRNKYSLSVGYVNDMGRFVTEMEPDPHRKYESRLFRAVKRLVNMEQDKAKEEMAWKIAEMIVHEITDLTLGVSTSDLSSRYRGTVDDHLMAVPHISEVHTK